MKAKIFLYLFVFAALTAIYLGVSGSRQIKSLDAKIQTLESREEGYKDSLQNSMFEILDMQYFSLENNDDALSYYDHLDMDDLSGYISDRLLESNEQKGDNPLVPYEGMNGDFKINKIKLLNHKWLIADFSDGKYWGELLITYDLKDNKDVDFNVKEHLLYMNSN
ncbi:MAG: hydrolase [Flavobacteriaceae bacterium]|nr:hydrolase [Flavobacteriaceae bacterium]MDH3796870.1 hydrolase [Flavobacteriaceae bacterium]